MPELKGGAQGDFIKDRVYTDQCHPSHEIRMQTVMMQMMERKLDEEETPKDG